MGMEGSYSSGSWKEEIGAIEKSRFVVVVDEYFRLRFYYQVKTKMVNRRDFSKNHTKSSRLTQAEFKLSQKADECSFASKTCKFSQK